MLDNLFECARTGKRRDVCGNKGCSCRPLALEMLVGKQSLFDHFWGEGNENMDQGQVKEEGDGVRTEVEKLI